MEQVQQFQHRKHGIVAVLAVSTHLTRVKTSLNHEFWVPSEQLEPYESPEARAARKLRDRVHVKLTKTVYPSDVLRFVIENYTSIRASVKESHVARFEDEWTAVTGEVCAEKYQIEAHPDRWGISTTIFFPTPPATMSVGDLNILPHPLVEGESFVCCNDFFWQVVAEVKRLGSHVRA